MVRTANCGGVTSRSASARSIARRTAALACLTRYPRWPSGPRLPSPGRGTCGDAVRMSSGLILRLISVFLYQNSNIWRTRMDQALAELVRRHLTAENAQDLDGTLATLHPECRFEDFATGQVW